MTTRRSLALLIFVLALLLAGGCALVPDHVTVYAERAESETAADRKGRTTATKIGASAAYDLSRR